MVWGVRYGMGDEDIPLVAIVLAVADAFDAMSADQSYRRTLPRHEVLGEIK